MIKEKLKYTTIPDDLVVEVSMSGTSLQRLKFLLQTYVATESEEKQMSTLLAAAALINPQAENDPEAQKLNKELEDDPYYQNVVTLYTLVATVEAQFMTTGKTVTNEHEVEISQEASDYLKKVRQVVKKTD